MLKADVFTLKGKTARKIALPKEVFGVKVNPKILAQAVRVYLANQRLARAKTKTRAEVAGSGRKIYRQKGTGRARHGDRYAPLFVGGGRAHGPTGGQNYKRKMSKKFNKLAILGALAGKFQEGRLAVAEGVEKIEPKARAMVKFLEKTGLGNKETKISLLVPQIKENLSRAARNNKKITLLSCQSLTAYDIIRSEILLVTPPAIEKLKEKYA